MSLSMSRRRVRVWSSLAIRVLATISFGAGMSAEAADGRGPDQLDRVVNETIGAVMKEHDIPGMAVAVTVQGKRYLFNYGVASKESEQKVDEDTLFEIGSISKTFTATLAAYAQVRGKLSFTDSASKYLPELAGSSFDRISLLDLGTYTAGGLPLQLPDQVDNQEKMIAYYKSWRPAYATGTTRLYSNPSIGLFGYLAARSMGEPFDDLMEKMLFPALGLTHTYIRVPRSQLANYAYGYLRTNKPVRVKPGVLASEAYGVKTTATDMLRFIEINMNSAGLDDAFQRAIAMTHAGYYKAGPMTQGLGWEIYPYPLDLDPLLEGISAMALKANRVNKFASPLAPKKDVLINKTGATNGFGAYAAFIPAKGVGIVILANKNYPIPARVKAAYRILAALDH